MKHLEKFELRGTGQIYGNFTGRVGSGEELGQSD